MSSQEAKVEPQNAMRLQKEPQTNNSCIHRTEMCRAARCSGETGWEFGYFAFWLLNWRKTKGMVAEETRPWEGESSP